MIWNLSIKVYRNFQNYTESMDTNKSHRKVEFKHANGSAECKSGLSRISKKRALEEDDSDGEQRRLVANTQERLRMQKINGALEDLKKCLPETFHIHHRRMSKIRALRCAMLYIRNMSQLLHEDNMRRQAQAQYAHAVEYMRSMRDPQYAMPQEEEAVHSPAPAASGPYYPYLGPLCIDSEASMYQTPEQNPPKHMYQPRPLDFSSQPENTNSVHAVTSSKNNHDPDGLITGIMETPVKQKQRTLSRPRRYQAVATPLSSRIYNVKSETFTSPLVGLRNDNELNLSFVSDHARDMPGEQTRPPSTFSDIVDGSCQY